MPDFERVLVDLPVGEVRVNDVVMEGVTATNRIVREVTVIGTKWGRALCHLTLKPDGERPPFMVTFKQDATVKVSRLQPTDEYMDARRGAMLLDHLQNEYQRTVSMTAQRRAQLADYLRRGMRADGLHPEFHAIHADDTVLSMYETLILPAIEELGLWDPRPALRKVMLRLFDSIRYNMPTSTSWERNAMSLTAQQAILKMVDRLHYYLG